MVIKKFICQSPLFHKYMLLNMCFQFPIILFHRRSAINSSILVSGTHQGQWIVIFTDFSPWLCWPRANKILLHAINNFTLVNLKMLILILKYLVRLFNFTWIMPRKKTKKLSFNWKKAGEGNNKIVTAGQWNIPVLPFNINHTK